MQSTVNHNSQTISLQLDNKRTVIERTNCCRMNVSAMYIYIYIYIINIWILLLQFKMSFVYKSCHSNEKKAILRFSVWKYLLSVFILKSIHCCVVKGKLKVTKPMRRKHKTPLYLQRRRDSIFKLSFYSLVSLQI